MSVIIEKFQGVSFGDRMTREDWLECVDCGGFIPYDGTLGEIIINDHLTAYRLRGWSGGWDFDTDSKKNKYSIVSISMEQFKNLQGKVEVMWYNR
jgi:hypothetical protein